MRVNKKSFEYEVLTTGYNELVKQKYRAIEVLFLYNIILLWELVRVIMTNKKTCLNCFLLFYLLLISLRIVDQLYCLKQSIYLEVDKQSISTRV